MPIYKNIIISNRYSIYLDQDLICAERIQEDIKLEQGQLLIDAIEIDSEDYNN